MEDTHFPMILCLVIFGVSPDVRLLDHRVALFESLEGKDRVKVDFLFLSGVSSLHG